MGRLPAMPRYCLWAGSRAGLALAGLLWASCAGGCWPVQAALCRYKRESLAAVMACTSAATRSQRCLDDPPIYTLFRNFPRPTTEEPPLAWRCQAKASHRRVREPRKRCLSKLLDLRSDVPMQCSCEIRCGEIKGLLPLAASAKVFADVQLETF